MFTRYAKDMRQFEYICASVLMSSANLRLDNPANNENENLDLIAIY